MREAIGAQVRSTGASRSVHEDGTKASSKAAFDDALKHAVGLLEKQQKIRREAEQGTPQHPSSTPQSSPQQQEVLPASLVSPQLNEKVPPVAAGRANDTRPQASSIVRQKHEQAQRTMEEAEERAIDVSDAALKAKQLTQRALQAIEALRPLL